MTAGLANLVLEQGSTFVKTLTWYDELGNLRNLTGYSAELQVRFEAEDEVLLYSANTTTGEIVLGGALGTIVITIPAAATLALDFIKAKYDLLLTSGAGVKTRLIEGAITLSKGVTR